MFKAKCTNCSDPLLTRSRRENTFKENGGSTEIAIKVCKTSHMMGHYAQVTSTRVEIKRNHRLKNRKREMNY